MLFEAMDFVALAKGVSALHKGKCPDLDFAHDSHVVFGLWENFHAVVGAAPDAEDLASQVSTETQDGLRSSYFVTDCLLSK